MEKSWKLLSGISRLNILSHGRSSWGHKMSISPFVYTKVSDDAVDVSELKQLLCEGLASRSSMGAMVEFSGFVRADKHTQQHSDAVEAIELEHYPAMTEKAFAKLISQAVSLWPCLGVVVYHRVGRIAVNQTIVYVAVSASHRAAAFACAEFIMDHLKTDKPLWKKEIFRQGQAWVEQKQSDIQAKSRWD